QLRQLIQTGLAEEAAHARDARIVGQLESRAILLVEDAQRVLLLLGALLHGSELVDRKRLAAEPRAALAEDDLAGRAHLHRDRRSEQKRREYDQQRAGTEDIEDTLPSGQRAHEQHLQRLRRNVGQRRLIAHSL